MADIITVEVTGAAAISYSLAPGHSFELVEFTLHLGSTPTTSEDFTATKNVGAGATYDVPLYTKDLSTIVADIYFSALPEEFCFEADDVLNFAYTNTDTVVYGLQMKYRRKS